MTLPEHLETSDPLMIGFYDSEMGGWFNGATGELAPGFPIEPHDVVVDVGCGDGGISAFTGRRGAHVILTDVNPDRVAAAVANLRGTVARIVEGHVADGAALPLADGTATRVICTEVLEHVDDPAATLRDIARVLAPGGLLLATVPGEKQEHVQKRVAYPAYFEKPNHIRIVSAAELDALVEGAGLTVERRGADGFFWSVYFAMFWQFGSRLGGRHPVLDRWAKVWRRTLDGRDGPAIKRALDAVLPKRQIVVARKPG